MKKFICTALTALMVLGMNLPAYAADYHYSLDYDQSQVFGKPTTSEVAPDYSAAENVRKDKNAAYFPPSYGVFSGEIDTDPTSKYHAQEQRNNITEIPSAAFYSDGPGEFLTSTSTMDYPDSSYLASAGNVTVGYSPQTVNTKITTISRYEDGSIGSISIPKLNLNVRVYPGTELSTLKIGVGHFDNTSEWDSNVGLASHNRGNASYFSGIWNLENGDIIKYTTKEGTRTYAVFYKEKISETDQSDLSATSDNILSLITCVENQSALRWLVQAREIQ